MIDEKLKLLADNLYQFMKEKRGWDRDPQIHYKFDDGNAKRFLGKTGYYDPDSEEIVIYCTKRHPKDILRSLAHELIHHVQKVEDRMTPEQAASENDESYILHDKFLRSMEEEAFLEGNLDLREWEAHMKENKEDPTIQESKKKKKKKKNKLSKLQLRKAKKMATSMEKKQGYSAEKAHKIAYAQVQKENKQLNEAIGEIVQPEVTVVVNDALKNSVVYNKDDRACNDLYSGRDELVYQALLKKFGIKK